MTTDVQQNGSGLDLVKWLGVVALIALAIVGNQYFADKGTLVRALGVVVLLGLAAFIALQTSKGRETLNFAKESRTEVRKVVWPTRQETVQTTFIVAAFVVVIALFLWGVDALLVWLLSFIIA